MPGWGLQQWGLGAWGGADLVIPGGPNNSLIVYRFPAPGAIEVREDAVVKVIFYDPDINLDTTTTILQIDGITVYSGLTGFATGYAGSVSYSAGALAVQVIKIGGWGFNTVVTVRAYIEDTTANVLDETWSWTTRANPVCYAGTNPLVIESEIQEPMQQFLELEIARKIFLDNALKEQNYAISNRGNKAARVLYQLAYGTELATIQNLYNPRDEIALASTVCERQNTRVIDVALRKYEKRIRVGITSLQNAGIFKEEYIRTFNDYLDSTLYNYRVSLVANLLLAARAIELQG